VNVTSAPARSRRGVAIALGIAGALLAFALLSGRPPRDGPPLDPRSDAPLGTSALVELLRRLDAEVELSVGLPDEGDDVALLLVDDLTDDQRTDLESWVRAGGRLVVATPGPLTPRPEPTSLLDPPLGTIDPATCSIGALGDIGIIDATDGVRLATDVATSTCYGDDAAAYVVATDTGAGTIVAIGGPGFAVNERLDELDNAPFAAALLAPEPGTAVRFVDPPTPASGGDKTLLELIPTGLRRAFLQLGVAFVLYALWRAIRLGKPVAEGQPVSVAGSELVAAVGRLVARTRSPGAAAAVLRTELRQSLARRLGLPPDAAPETVADAAADRTGVDRAVVLSAVADTPITTDEDLVTLARAAATTRQEVLR
jgi:hypothetical protein